MKAFLSHSSEDRDFVNRVANRLGRSKAEYASQSFSPGFDFRDLIRKSLAKSNVFVFFVSAKSLDSSWVKYEFNEAEWLYIHGEISGAISIIIDDKIKPGDLPHWMQRCLTMTILNAKTAAYIIQNYMVQLEPETEPIFIGRENDMANFSKELLPNIEKEQPRVLIVAGLEGIGRKTFGLHTIKNYLGLNFGPKFILDETDSLDTLYLQLINENKEFTERAKLAEAIKEFHELNIDQKCRDIARLLTLVNQNNLIPVVVDACRRG